MKFLGLFGGSTGGGGGRPKGGRGPRGGSARRGGDFFSRMRQTSALGGVTGRATGTQIRAMRTGGARGPRAAKALGPRRGR